LRKFNSKLEEAVQRIQRLEDQVDSSADATPWCFLVARPHAWRRQLCIKGRNMTVGQLVSTITANKLTPAAAAADLELPLEAIQEALAYFAANEALIEMEASEERRRLAQRGYRLEPENLSG
jgi:uncharacterized protein (DUF433 family)